MTAIPCVENFRNIFGPLNEFLILWKRYSKPNKSHVQKQKDERETDELCKVQGDSFGWDALACAFQEMRLRWDLKSRRELIRRSLCMPVDE